MVLPFTLSRTSSGKKGYNFKKKKGIYIFSSGISNLQKKSFEYFAAFPSVLCFLKSGQRQPSKSQGFIYYNILCTCTFLQLVYKDS